MTSIREETLGVNLRVPCGNTPHRIIRNSNTKFEKKRNLDVGKLSDVDHVVTDASASQCEAQL